MNKKCFDKNLWEPIGKFILELCVNEFKNKLIIINRDRPDIREINNRIGIEFVLVGEEKFFNAINCFDENKYDSSDEKEIKKYEKLMNNCGFKIDRFGYTSFAIGQEEVIENIKLKYIEKIKKLQDYEQLDRYDLMMFCYQKFISNERDINCLLYFFIKNNTEVKKYSKIYISSFNNMLIFDLTKNNIVSKDLNRKKILNEFFRLREKIIKQ